MELVICPYLSIGGRIGYLCVVNVHREFNFQKFHVLPPFDLAVEFDRVTRAIRCSLKTNNSLDPTGLADLGLDKDASPVWPSLINGNFARTQLPTGL